MEYSSGYRLLETGTLPLWQVMKFLIGALFIGFPAGAETVNLTAFMLMAAAIVPYGARMLAK